MSSIVIAASPLTYAEYQKLSLADARARHPKQYIFLPLFSIIPLVVTATLLANNDFATIGWDTLGILLLLPAISTIVWLATWLTIRRNYSRNEVLRNGVVYHLDAQRIVQEGNIPQTILWSDIARNAKQVGEWILLRHAAAASSEIYFLNTNSVMLPAIRTELLDLLKSKRVKPI
ncbi:hypothetical protein Q5H93_16135 [Hymenobacter sp. ASUV-10]|uniref:YcxB family protein n=1 Tax=Hymenobacter aranciens TaxID=3063996 RepID=A0ABT9BDE9_9BACT|nr:hypothetical protein [Hymenobacter sp. ASUV-10]MDO7876275.1 hypothetical protein [Hymenobacter sp. ASUV-10]